MPDEGKQSGVWLVEAPFGVEGDGWPIRFRAPSRSVSEQLLDFLFVPLESVDEP